MAHAIDLAFCAAAAAIVYAEQKRGFAKAVLDFLALAGALLASAASAPALAQHAGFSPLAAVNDSWSFGVCFAAFLFLTLTFTRTLDRAMRVEFGIMNAPLGALTGLGVAVLVLHCAAILMHYGAPSTLSQSALGSEALSFKTYHVIVDGFTSLEHSPTSLHAGSWPSILLTRNASR